MVGERERTAGPVLAAHVERKPAPASFGPGEAPTRSRCEWLTGILSIVTM